MATPYYWDPYTTGTTSISWFPNGLTNTTATTSPIPSWLYVRFQPRKLLIPIPEKWTEEQSSAFVRLVNVETHTGWTVELVIKGDIVITDPDIEKRSMVDFIPLLKSKATYSDKEKINNFLVSNPIE